VVLGGADTVSKRSLYHITLTLTLYFLTQTVSTAVILSRDGFVPEVQKKAQMEIDAVIGNNRLPDFSDMDALPYTNAIVKEAMRWQPVTPLGGLIKLLSDFQSLIVVTVVHMCTADDEDDGYFTSKGTIVMGKNTTIG